MTTRHSGITFYEFPQTYWQRNEGKTIHAAADEVCYIRNSVYGTGWFLLPMHQSIFSVRT